uniref:Uncharacterized protein n=1 Tax=Lepeophtheirus salmonis TaxID=72036 RepID=A0A0K2UR42_LEPSM
MISRRINTIENLKLHQEQLAREINTLMLFAESKDFHFCRAETLSLLTTLKVGRKGIYVKVSWSNEWPRTPL